MLDEKAKLQVKLNNSFTVYYHLCFSDEKIEVLWECIGQNFGRKHMTYSIGSFEESLIKQLFTKVRARIRGKSTCDGAVSWG